MGVGKGRNEGVGIRVIGLVLAVGLTGLVSRSEAQGPPGGPPFTDPNDVSIVGQWAGPWDFEEAINPLVDLQGEPIIQWREIAHAILLPDKSNTGRTRVLFICQREGMPDGTTPAWPLPSAYIWDPADPTELLSVPMPPDANNFENRSEDPFCGGHSFTPGGDVVFFGGTDSLSQQTFGGVWGHDAVYVFINDPTDAYSWVRVGDMSRARWYPTATALNDGSILAEGHAGNPTPSSPITEDTFERGTITYSGSQPTGIAWQPLTVDELPAGVHQNLSQLPSDCVTSVDTLTITDYPRQHSLLSGEVFMTGQEPTATNPIRVNGFLNLLGCPSGTTTHRWARGPTAGDFPQIAERGSVLLTNLSGLTPMEYLYGLGGSLRLFVDISDQVVRSVNPSASSVSWVDTDAPDLNLNAYDGNYTILLDGSILKVGGYGEEPDPQNPTGPPLFPARRQPELLEPDGIFASPGSTWTLMREQFHERRYHSVAVTLPNGKVVSAGGTNQQVSGSTPEPSWWSVDMFTPPYLFAGQRPKITSFPTEMTLGDEYEFDAILRTGSIAGEFRVALLAPGAATHAFDQHQHYISLERDAVAVNPDPHAPSEIRVFAPNSGTVPHGWYMLTVVNSVGIPSVAKWIKLTP